MNPDGHFFNGGGRCARNFRTYDMAAAGQLCLGTPDEYDYPDLQHDHIFYGCSTKVRSNLKGQGYGDLLYKALVLAAIKHAKDNKIKDWVFGPHRIAGGSTSTSAMRVYRSLARKGYLKRAPSRGKDLYVPGKIPKNFKPIFY
jgi:GNAT superfamily N-acetyltransferase